MVKDLPPVDCVILNSGTLRADELMPPGEFKMKVPCCLFSCPVFSSFFLLFALRADEVILRGFTMKVPFSYVFCERKRRLYHSGEGQMGKEPWLSELWVEIGRGSCMEHHVAQEAAPTRALPTNTARQGMVPKAVKHTVAKRVDRVLICKGDLTAYDQDAAS